MVAVLSCMIGNYSMRAPEKPLRVEDFVEIPGGRPRRKAAAAGELTSEERQQIADSWRRFLAGQEEA